MDVLSSPISGVVELRSKVFSDTRGQFLTASTLKILRLLKLGASFVR